MSHIEKEGMICNFLNLKSIMSVDMNVYSTKLNDSVDRLTAWKGFLKIFYWNESFNCEESQNIDDTKVI